MDGLDFDDHLARESARFARAMSDARPDAPVPTCPGWDADDLLWHLGKVQAFWGRIVRDRITDAERTRSSTVVRPDTRAGLTEFFDASSRALREALADARDSDPAWTWATDQSVGFIRRRQVHEALIHRVDAEATAGPRTTMDPRLCADGVDEVLRVMYAGEPSWGTFAAEDGCTVRLTARDTGDSWLVTLGRFTGVDPDSGAPVDETDIRVLDADPADAVATIEGTAADLDCWLWHRPPPGGAPSRQGDEDALARFTEVVSQPLS